jgi:hypothetical protein
MDKRQDPQKCRDFCIFAAKQIWPQLCREIYSGDSGNRDTQYQHRDMLSQKVQCTYIVFIFKTLSYFLFINYSDSSNY